MDYNTALALITSSSITNRDRLLGIATNAYGGEVDLLDKMWEATLKKVDLNTLDESALLDLIGKHELLTAAIFACDKFSKDSCYTALKVSGNDITHILLIKSKKLNKEEVLELISKRLFNNEVLRATLETFSFDNEQIISFAQKHKLWDDIVDILEKRGYFETIEQFLRISNSAKKSNNSADSKLVGLESFSNLPMEDRLTFGDHADNSCVWTEISKTVNPDYYTEKARLAAEAEEARLKEEARLAAEAEEDKS